MYVYLNHNLIKAFLYDAKAFIHVEGEWDDDLMTNTFEARPMGGGSRRKQGVTPAPKAEG